MFLENHHSSVRPTKSLFFVLIKIARRESFSKRMIDIDDVSAVTLYA